MTTAHLDAIHVPTIRIVEVRGHANAWPHAPVFGLLFVSAGLARARGRTAADGSFTLRFTINGPPTPKCNNGNAEYGFVHVGGGSPVPIT